MNRFLRLPEVLKRVPYSRPTLYRKIAASRFPKSYDLDGNGRTVAWLESEIEAWIAERLEAARNAKVA